MTGRPVHHDARRDIIFYTTPLWTLPRNHHHRVHSVLQVSASACDRRNRVLGTDDRAEQALQAETVALAQGLLWPHVPCGCSSCHLIGWVGISISSAEIGEGTEVKVGEDGAAASWALDVEPQPLVNTLDMEVVCTGEATDLERSGSMIFYQHQIFENSPT